MVFLHKIRVHTVNILFIANSNKGSQYMMDLNLAEATAEVIRIDRRPVSSEVIDMVSFSFWFTTKQEAPQLPSSFFLPLHVSGTSPWQNKFPKRRSLVGVMVRYWKSFHPLPLSDKTDEHQAAFCVNWKAFYIFGVSDNRWGIPGRKVI